MIKMWSVGHEFKIFFLLILPPQTLMSWNGLASAHYVACVAWLTLTGSPGALPNMIKARGLTIP
jgi:hypothetical protein